MSLDIEIRIDRRFRGPPDSGNGGYVCGVLAAQLEGPATVRLLAPPPLDRPLQLRTEEDALRLFDGDRPIAQARPAMLELVPPPAPDLAAVRAVAPRYVGFHSHPFPGCFVCGPQRREDDGLRIFPAAVDGFDLVAAVWTPAANLAAPDGLVRSEFVWSALDCTGFFAFAPLPEGAPALLGELSARIDGDVRAGEPHLVSGWRLGSEGRKRFAGSAIHAADGRPIAVARATWIVVPPGTAGSPPG